ncbi:MAG: hypothetical protein EOP56_19350 [Sphingobacteriales bacterium]|nr:MAG: hypothetical protein EOP56_19350 [Sphingobacteriales bacterium]
MLRDELRNSVVQLSELLMNWQLLPTLAFKALPGKCAGVWSNREGYLVLNNEKQEIINSLTYCANDKGDLLIAFVLY